MSSPTLILASSSKYRRSLLERAGFAAKCIAPDIDETPVSGESPEACALRLSVEKAAAIAKDHPNDVVIGSDQVAALGDAMLGKPGDFESAREQLTAQSGQTVLFHTGLCVRLGQQQLTCIETTCVRFRTLSELEIKRYLEKEQPFDCAGSFKSEGLGIHLFERVESQDPSALIGLPLIKTAQFLRQFGLNVLL